MGRKTRAGEWKGYRELYGDERKVWRLAFRYVGIVEGRLRKVKESEGKDGMGRGAA